MIRYLKTIVFYLSLVVILVLYLVNRTVGLILASLFFLAYFVIYLVSLSSKRKLLKILREYSLISDTEISRVLARPLEDIRNILFSLAKNQKNRKWLVVFLNNRYFFLNEKTVKNYKELYHMGYNEKKILEHLQRHTRIRSRAEVKAIELTLASQNRLDDH
ncbi:MAG: hypothetical protein ACFE9R_05780 [Candidatus Hermodarchaeota archaeon]